MFLLWILMLPPIVIMAYHPGLNGCTMVKYPDATFEGYPVPTYVAKESVIAFRCREKYFDGQFYARCEGNNLWKRQGPECTLVKCSEPEVHHTAKATGKDRGLNAKVTYSCDEGYMYTGTRTRICQRNGLWSGYSGHCQVIKCQRLPILLNGGYQPAKYSVNYGNEVVAVCDKGYAYNGSRTRVCQENNKWSGVQGTCTETTLVKCPSMRDQGQSKLKFTPDKQTYQYQDEIRIDCEEGHNYIGRRTIKCGINNTWSGRVGFCERVLCLLRPTLHGRLFKNVTNFVPHVYGQTFMPQCIQGFLYKGNPQSCGQNGSWVGLLGECQAIKCENLTQISNGHIQSSGIAYKEVARVFCDDGYRLMGSESIRCQLNGTWTALGQCIAWDADKSSTPILFLLLILLLFPIGVAAYLIFRRKCQSRQAEGMAFRKTGTPVELEPMISGTSYSRDFFLDEPIDLDKGFIHPRILMIPTTSTQRLSLDNQVQPTELTLTTLENIIKQGDVILIQGRAGVGTTTLVQKIFHDCKKLIWGKMFRLILLIDVRRLPVLDEVLLSLEDFLIMYAIPHNKEGDPNNFDLSETEDALIIVDTQDMHFAEEPMQDVPIAAEPLQWLVSVMKRKVLKKTTLIVTSSHKNIEYFKKMDVTLKAEVVGFTNENIKEYITKHVKKNHQSSVLNILEKNVVLMSVSTIAIYCKMLCQILTLESYPQSSLDALETYTEIWVFIIEALIKCHNRDDDNPAPEASSISELANFAFEKLLFEKGQMAKHVFSKNRFKGKRYVQFALEARLMVESGEDEESAYFVFIHSAVQDVLAMAFLLTLNTETIKRVLTNMWDGGNLGSALFFLFGLRYGRSSSIARLLKLVEGKDVVQESLPDLKIMIIDFIQNETKMTEYQSMCLIMMLYEGRCPSIFQGEERALYFLQIPKTIFDFPLTSIDSQAKSCIEEYVGRQGQIQPS